MSDSGESLNFAEAYGVSSEFILSRASLTKRVPGKDGPGKGQGSPSPKEPAPAVEDEYDEDADLNSGKREYKGGDAKGHVDLEQWWLKSSLWQRLIPFMLLIFLVVFIMQLTFAIFCFATVHWEVDEEDPYVCRTQACHTRAEVLRSDMNEKVDPCVDFYEYACGGYNNPEEDPNSIPKRVRLDHAFLIFSADQEAIIGNILKPMGDSTDQLIELYKACIDMKRREADGLDPLLRIVRDSLPTFFENDPSVLDQDRLYDVSLKEYMDFWDKFGEGLDFSMQFLPNHKITFTRPDWVRYIGPSIRDRISSPALRQSYEAEVGTTFRLIWARMAELGLCKDSAGPYPADDAGRYVVAIVNHLLNYVYNPEAAPIDFDLAKRQRWKLEVEHVIQLILGWRPGAAPIQYTLQMSEVKVERTAFGAEWDDAAGRMLSSFAKGGEVDLVVRVDRDGNPVPAAPDPYRPPVYYFRAIHALHVFLILNIYSVDILPKQWKDYNLDKVFPDHFKQDLQGLVKTESYCLSLTVSHLRTYTQVRMSRLQTQDHRDELKEKMEDLKVNLVRSLRRWYVMKERAGELDPRMSYVMELLFAPETPIKIRFPVPDQTPAVNKSLERKLRSRSAFRVDPTNFIGSVHAALQLRYKDRVQAWKDNLTVPRENEDFYLDFVNPYITTDDYTRYKNWIHFPLLLMEPPYFLNDMPVFDYSGTALFMAKALLHLWLANSADPGNFDIPKERWDSLRPFNPALREPSECSSVNMETRSEGGKTSFQNYITSADEQGLTTLAFKVAYDLFTNPERFARMVNRATGEVHRPALGSTASTEYSAPEYYTDGTTTYFMFTKHENGTTSRRPLDNSRFVSDTEFSKKLRYKRLVDFENVTLSRIFFLNSINDLCFTGSSKFPRWVRYKRLLNGVFQQLDEFAEAWGCSKLSPMNPPDNCFIEKD